MPNVRVSDLPQVEVLLPKDLFHVVTGYDPEAGALGESVAVSWDRFQSLSRPPLLVVTSDHVAGPEGGFAAVPADANTTLTITLPPLDSVPGREYQFVIGAPGTLAVAADPGDGAIIRAVSVPAMTSMTLSGVAVSFRLRALLLPAPGLSGWFPTCV